MGTKYSFAVGVIGILGIVGDRIFSVNGLPAWEAPNECSEIKETSAISLKDAGSTPCAHAAGLNRRADATKCIARGGLVQLARQFPTVRRVA